MIPRVLRISPAGQSESPGLRAVVRPEARRQGSMPKAKSRLGPPGYSAILATCKSNPVLGSSAVNANALNPAPVISVCR